jgi:WD40 repeat protein
LGRFERAIYSPDETKIAVVQTLFKSRLKIFDAQTCMLLTRVKMRFNGALEFGFSPDGELLVATLKSAPQSAPQDTAIYFFNTRIGELVAKIEGHKPPGPLIDLAKDGTKIIAGSLGSNARIWDLDKINSINAAFNESLSRTSNFQQKVLALQPFDHHDKYYSPVPQVSFSIALKGQSIDHFKSI